MFDPKNLKSGDTAIYSDLSPWELCLIEGPAVKNSEDFDYEVRFYNDNGTLEEDTLEVQSDGMRENTPANREKYLS